jgi:hypothetical protein
VDAETEYDYDPDDPDYEAPDDDMTDAVDSDYHPVEEDDEEYHGECFMVFLTYFLPFPSSSV